MALAIHQCSGQATSQHLQISCALCSGQAQAELKRVAFLRRNSQIPKKRDIARNKYILEIVQKHETGSVLDFHQGIAHNITYE